MTNHLNLRTLEKEDLTFLHKLFNNPKIMSYWFSESYMSMEHLKESFDKNKDNQANREFVLTNSDEEKIGFVSLYDIEQRHRNAEFAIIIDPLHQGNGYAAPATELAMDYAFSVLNLHKLYLIVANINEKAGYIYEKVGFQVEGTLKEHFFVNGDYIDGIIMGIFQHDYWNMQKNEK